MDNMESFNLHVPARGVEDLERMSFSDLENIKSHLELVRKRILALQNLQSPFLRLPGEIRNQVLVHAMHMELVQRRRNSKQAALYTQPAFFAVNRQFYDECRGLWFNDVLSWEECDAGSRDWRRLGMEEIQMICKERSKTGQLQIVTQPAHCDLGRTREGVEGSRSICSRKGLVRLQGIDVVGMPQMRWWMW